MGDKTGIEWTDATWNPATGCTKVSQGCKNCYAKYQAWPRLAASANTVYYGRPFEDVQTHYARLYQPLKWRRPRRIFVNSMSDLFHEAIPDEFIQEVFAVMALASRHRFQVLTKRPQRMLAFCNDPMQWAGVEGLALRRCHGTKQPWIAVDGPLLNVWLGVSVEDQATADERIPILLDTAAAIRWVSAEPLLAPVDIFKSVMLHPFRALDWVVVGGESGSKARPMHPAWPLSIRDQCIAAGVPFLFKQWGEWLPEEDTPLITAARQICVKQTRNAQSVTMLRVGKKRAGRRLEGELWDGYPTDVTRI